MRLARALDDKKMDLRLRDKLVHEGKLTKKDVEGYFNSLPDDAERATYTEETEEKEGSHES